jgi:hypothetical protein
VIGASVKHLKERGSGFGGYHPVVEAFLRSRMQSFLKETTQRNSFLTNGNARVEMDYAETPKSRV